MLIAIINIKTLTVDCVLVFVYFLHIIQKMDKNLSTKNDILAGAFAGAFARLLTAPFDVLKIRFQLQSKDNRKYTSIIQSIQTIIREEGVYSLWKGNISATWLWITYSMIQFSCFGFLKNLGLNLADQFNNKNSNNGGIMIDSKRPQPTFGLLKSLVIFMAGAGNNFLDFFFII